MTKVCFVAVIAAFITGCSGAKTKEIVRIGDNIDNVRYQLGVPLENIIDLPNGNKMWTFSKSSSMSIPSTIYTGSNKPNYYGNANKNEMHFSCVIQIETTKSGTIVGGFLRGNDCP